MEQKLPSEALLNVLPTALLVKNVFWSRINIKTNRMYALYEFKTGANAFGLLTYNSRQIDYLLFRWQI